MAEATLEKTETPLLSDPEAEFLRIAHKRFQQAVTAEQDIRKASLDDMKFRSGDQWPQDIKIQRSKDGRPCLEMDRIEQFVRQVCNEERQQRPSIQVNPVGDGADTETAEVEQGLVRHIEVQSQADVARDHAFEMMVTIGFGYYRILVEEDEDDEDDLEIAIRRIKNPFTVYFSPGCDDPVYADARWCFVISDMSKEEFRQEYPDSQMAALTDFASIGDNTPQWVTKDDIRVAEYFYVEGKGKNRKVKWAKIDAIECIEGGPDDEIEWQGKWIPIIPVLGIDLDVNGRRFLAGLVRKLKDPQRQYNYMNSAATEAIALAPKAPFIAVEGQLENHETEWRQSNQRNFPVLQYKNVTAANQTPLPPPSRESVEPPIQAMMLMVKQANDDLQGAAGIFNPSQGGAPLSSDSGKAVLARQKTSDLNNINWTDNLARSIWFEGKQLLDLIPKVYTEPKVRRIINPDGTVKNVGITNSQNGPDADTAMDLLDVPQIYDIGVGKYDVTISVGPSYQSKRQEAVASQLAFLQAFPQAAPVIGDIVVGNMDWPGAKDIQKRLKKMLPPQLQEQDGTPESQLAQAQSQIQQMTPLLQQQHQIIGQLQQEREAKMLEQQTKKDIEVARIQADLQGKTLQYQTQLAVAQINASKDANQSYAENELEQFGLLHQSAHEVALSQQEHQQAMQQGQQQADNAQQMAAQAAQQQPNAPEQPAQQG